MHVNSSSKHVNTDDQTGQIFPSQFKLAFIFVTSLFFLWAIAHNLNDILIRQFQKALDLSRGQASFIQISFYLAYFFAAIPAGLLMKRLGFKNAIVIGLLFYAFGAALFYPAAEIRSYGFFLIALFILACGIVILETSGSGYITLVGDPKTATRRINFSQSFNGVGAITAPIIGGLFIFSGIEYSPEQIAAMSAEKLTEYRILEAQQVQLPYLVIALVLTWLALLITLTRFPKSQFNEQTNKKTPVCSLLEHKNFVWSVVGQFFYVGAQIGIWSYFIDFAIDVTPNTTEKMAAYYLSASLFAFMAGRFIGTYLMKSISPRKLLSNYSIACIALTALAIFSGGYIALLSLALTSFFMSIMFPTIYALGLANLGEKAEIGSSFIIMTIISGAIIPPMMGFIANDFNIQWAYTVPLICFLVVWTSTRLGKES